MESSTRECFCPFLWVPRAGPCYKVGAILCHIIVSEQESCFLSKTRSVAIHVTEFSFSFYFLLTGFENRGEGWVGTEDPDGERTIVQNRGGPPRKETRVTPALTGSSPCAPTLGPDASPLRGVVTAPEPPEGGLRVAGKSRLELERPEFKSPLALYRVEGSPTPQALSSAFGSVRISSG